MGGCEMNELTTYYICGVITGVILATFSIAVIIRRVIRSVYDELEKNG